MGTEPYMGHLYPSFPCRTRGALRKRNREECKSWRLGEGQDQWQQRRANPVYCVTNGILGERDTVDVMSAMDDLQAGGVSICVRKEKREASQMQGQRKGEQG